MNVDEFIEAFIEGIEKDCNDKYYGIGFRTMSINDLLSILKNIKEGERMKEGKGKKYDQGKIRTDLLSTESISGTAKILTFGAKKYGDRNWENGIDFNRVYGAALRHLYSWWGGEDKDKETGESHLHHASCCIHFLQHYIENPDKYKGFDNRPSKKDSEEK